MQRALQLAFAAALAACADPPPVTYVDDVAPILARHCVGCHNPQGSAPFALLDYDDARRKAGPIAQVTANGSMPPWKPRAGGDVFHGARGLTADERGLLARWSRDGAAAGEGAEAIALEAPTPGWALGDPDVVLTMDQPFLVPADGGELWASFAVSTDFGGDRYLRGVEIRHANAKPVHHVILWIDPEGSLRDLAEAGAAGPGSLVQVDQAAPGEILGGWIPGIEARAFPDHTAALLPAGADLVFEHHFVTTGRPEEIRTSLGLHFATEPPERPLGVIQLTGGAIHVLPGERDYSVRSTTTLPVETELIAITPHAHYVCRGLEITARLPDGDSRSLIAIDDWDPAWQSTYWFVDPPILPAGTAVELAFTLDNSASNPRNPHRPPRRVIFGARSDQEMAEVFCHVVARDAEAFGRLREALVDAVRGAGNEHRVWQALVDQFDADGDGSLDAEEDAAASLLVDGIWDQPELLLRVADSDDSGDLDEAERAEVQRWIGVWHGQRD
ncbi:hypothetical protein [Engelhardtia mirabilis]|uniref:EF-hand domain-containing protein n=1 Tax=Engelhardtia mirabilis TaxID=2528011 RepID=A0A518BHL8_9BACT|nr:hypothetical protein Pla133_15060 [Planctomycetes bacterium Pla133]QDV00759.1 hypothetical protein Pla86_15050 [Planctomycetes bacterium Pla86]